MRYLSFCLTITLSIVVTCELHAQVPDTISVQGMLTDPGGVPVNDTLDITTTFYKGGVAGHTQVHSNVPIQGGIFNLAIGPVDTVRFDQPIDIGITVGLDSEMSPRTPLLSAPTALSLRGLRVIPSGNADDGPTMVAGHNDNGASSGVVGATIGGGGKSGSFLSNQVTANYTTIGGGRGNDADAAFATVGGGLSNLALTTSSTVAGGQTDTASGQWATVSGGSHNVSSESYATVGGGQSNVASGPSAVIGGGSNNRAENGAATVGGGSGNHATGLYWTIPGGNFNTASGDYSFAAGRRAVSRTNGTFVWADGTNSDFASNSSDQFLIRANGGVGINTTSPDAQFT